MDNSNVAYCLEGLATIVAFEDHLQRTAKLWGAAEGGLEEIKVIAYAHASDRSLHHSRVNAACEKLSQRAWAKGQT